MIDHGLIQKLPDDDINVPLDKLHLLNRSAEGNWKHTPAQYGGGAEANVEVFHQLHCLVRMATHWLE